VINHLRTLTFISLERIARITAIEDSLSKAGLRDLLQNLLKTRTSPRSLYLLTVGYFLSGVEGKP
jgi:hypothetical protein